MTNGTPNDVTLGEVYRRLSDLIREFEELREEVVRSRVANEVLEPKVRRLENIVYGAGAVAFSALIMSLLSLVLKGN